MAEKEKRKWTEMAKIRVEVSKPYDVIVERGVLDRAAELISGVTKSKKIAVITDDTVDSLYGERLINNLNQGGFDTSKFVFPHGEQNKNAGTYVEILNFLADRELTRSDTVLALGGGVVGDMAGFAAATYLRGIRYIQMPTTLLSAVDSSVGGKCAIDLDRGKNLAGAFHQPSLVLCDPDALTTLPRDILMDGCGEVLKYGILADPELLSHITENGEDFDAEYVISRCVKLKAEIVSEDEFDHGRRAFLNLGHTTAHAIEKLSKYSVSHGSAVATGCAITARISETNGFCSKECAVKIEKAVKSLGHSAKTSYTAEEICDIMLSDKKRHGDFIDFITVRDIGKCSIETVSTNELLGFVQNGI